MISDKLSTLYNKAKGWLIHTTSSYYSFMFSVLTVVFGIWVASPLGTLVIESYLNDIFWGFAAILSGALLIVSTVWFRHTWWQVVGILSGFYYWLFLCVSLALSNITSAGWILTGWISIMYALGYINYKLNPNPGEGPPKQKHN